MTQVCSICFHENPDGVVFCEACGIELTSVPTTTTPPPPPSVIEEKTPLISPLIEEKTPPPPSVTTSIQVEAPTRLISKNPGSPVAQFPLEGTSLLIGRFDPDLGPVEIDLEGFPGDDTISRNHAEIYFEGGCWKIKDLGSVNGVFIKKAGQPRFGPRIVAPEVINTLDEISIAKIRFLLE